MMKLFADWKKNNGISRIVLITYRFGNAVHYKVRLPVLRQILLLIYRTLDLFITKAIAGADIPAQAKIGHGLFLPHNANGVVIHPSAIIGSNVTIVHQVTIGSNGVGNNGAPTIGDYAYIGVGSKVLGRINIGEHAKIGASAVVLRDVPDYATAVGIPAKIITGTVSHKQMKG